MRVEELMTGQVATCRADATLADAARIMWEHDCGSVPVVEDDRLVGIVTDRDALMAAFTRGRRLDELAVDAAMARDVRTCQPRDHIQNAERVMREAKVHRLPVVDYNGRLVGILALADLARHVHTGLWAASGLSAQSVALTLASISESRSGPAPAR